MLARRSAGSQLPCLNPFATALEDRSANGAATLQEMRRRIMRYRNTAPEDRSDFAIGCWVLIQPFFLKEPDWIPVPPGWSRQIVAFKTYSTDESDGQGLVEAVSDRIESKPALGRDPWRPSATCRRLKPMNTITPCSSSQLRRRVSNQITSGKRGTVWHTGASRVSCDRGTES